MKNDTQVSLWDTIPEDVIARIGADVRARTSEKVVRIGEQGGGLLIFTGELHGPLNGKGTVFVFHFIEGEWKITREMNWNG